MISVLVPSRNRPDQLARLVQSGNETAVGPIEFVVRVDDDDPSYDGFDCRPNVTIIRGARSLLSKLWNDCHAVAQGPFYFHCGDDIVMRTVGWDYQVEHAFPADRIAFVHGDDGDPTHGPKFGTHGFLHDRWIDAVGYFVPPYFSSDWNDSWLNEVADAIGRRIHIPIVTEHMHPAYGKAELDVTHRERIARHQQDDCDSIYRDLAPQRAADAEKLREAIRCASA